MKRFRSSRSSESLLTSIPMSSSSSSPRDEVGLGPAEEFEAMLDRLDEEGKMSEKKRRLSLSQVKALEKHFEADKKLEPDRKAKIAAEIGMQPRQVAIWFQNRRARCKNKQLEMEYEVLKMSYEELKLSCENFEREKTALKTELRDLKMKVGDGRFSESEKNVSDRRISTSGESESNNMNNVVAPTRQSVLHYNNQTSSSSCLLQFDSSSWNLQQGLNWFSRVYGAAGDEAPADPSRLALEQFDY